MSPETSAVRGLARSLIRMHSGDATAESVAAGAETALELLARRISPLLGASGYDMLVMRAASRARRRHAVLPSVEAASLTEEGMRGWVRRIGDEEGAEEATAAAESVLAELIGLLTRFLGAHMAIGLVRQAFPDLAAEEVESGSEESNDD